MKIGDRVKIKEYGPIPELFGVSGEIVDLQMQEFEKYRVYPIWVKMTFGKYAGKIYGFKYDEVEMLPRLDESQVTSVKKKRGDYTKVIEQMEELSKSVTTV